MQLTRMSASLCMVVLFFFLLPYVVYSNASPQDLLAIAQRVTDDVNAQKLVLPYFNGNYIWSEMWRINVDRFFRNYSGDIPVLFYPLWVGTDGFGNSVGHYLEAMTCAKHSGMHFVGFDTDFWYHESTSPSNISRIFSQSLTKLVVHPTPVSSMDQINIDSCWRNQFPWQASTSLMWGNLPEIRRTLQDFTETLRRRLDFGLRPYKMSDFDSIIQDGIRHINAEERYGSRRRLRGEDNAAFTFIPNVSILFRCADMLLHDEHSPYGFINFNTYKYLIPKDATEIYILSESLYYSGSRQMPLREAAKACVNITDALASFLANEFVNATIGIRRGHSAEGFYQLSHSPVMISPPSSFGFYASLAQDEYHHVYFPETVLIQGDFNPFVKRNYHWMPFPKIIQFGEYYAKHGIINVTAFLSMLTAPL